MYGRWYKIVQEKKRSESSQPGDQEKTKTLSMPTTNTVEVSNNTQMEPLVTRLVGTAIADIIANLGLTNPSQKEPNENTKQRPIKHPNTYKTRARGRPPK